ncbi:MAG: endolytic transglycosylase MltG [Patescibacteria group bacterium]
MLSPESQHTYALYIRNTLAKVGRYLTQYEKVVPDVLFFGILFSLIYFVVLSAPLSFPSGTLVKVPQGSTVAAVANKLKDRHIIRSVFLFEAAARLSGQKVIAGEYYFENPQNVIIVASRLARGEYDLKPVRVTIPEGANSYEITSLLAKALPDFDADMFRTLATPKEGFLFPDTYFFYPGAEPELVLQTLQNNFTTSIARIATTTLFADKPITEIVTMASILEEEAATTEDRRIIAGILWRRIEIGMALQVDAVFPYIIGKNSFELTSSDLKTNSPYNTYANKGLPPGPISNPGLDAIAAAMTPLKTTYLYFLSDRQGNFHYCSTYVCHVANKQKYLGT